MLASYNWLRELSAVEATPGRFADKLTAAGLVVDAASECGRDLSRVVVAEVRGIRPHPSRAKLTVVTVYNGDAERDVVCGAPNVPSPGRLVVLADIGARLPSGAEISARRLGGIASQGMLCSEAELGVGPEESGILVLEAAEGLRPGAAFADALRLRDTVFDIEVTPNRPDCLGHVGLARELCALFARPFELPRAAPAARWTSAAPLPSRQGLAAIDLRDHCGSPVSTVTAGHLVVPPLDIRIIDSEGCPRYGAALVLGLTIGPSPFALRYRLHSLGLRPISNVVDATNEILLKWGHPIHAFDLDRVRGVRIVVRRAGEAERMATLDGHERTLSCEDLLICDGEGPVAIAGVMGGRDSEVGVDTTGVLIECAYFEPRSVRRTSRRLGLQTDSSYRFERGVDPHAVAAVLADAACRIAALTGGAVVPEALDAYPRRLPARAISLRPARLDSQLGVAVDPSEVALVLQRLGCVVDAADAAWRVTAPAFRPDLQREADLVEEVARVRGYDSIPVQQPRVCPSGEGTSEAIRFERRLRESAAAAGFDEAVNYVFVSAQELEASRVSTRAVRLANPLSEQRPLLRTSLLPGLLNNVKHAQHHQVKGLALFELARVFDAMPGGKLPRERQELALLVAGPRSTWFNDAEASDFYDLKGRLQAVLRPVIAGQPQTELDDSLEARASYLHPRRRARVVLGGSEIGVAGELHPDVTGSFEVEGRVLYAGLDVAALHAARRRLPLPRAKPLPRFPSVSRDIAVVVQEDLAVGDVRGVLKQAAGELAEDVVLFDIYRGVPVPEGHKSLAFHVVYRSPTSTLTDRVVEPLHNKLVRTAERRFGARLR
ncbi:MAG: phenylalanine--tRNA ligase subunit beta [Proteobacteria bacterium]|nr:phenylalanine--tRNA ligase subunit beta [Pseudomonadota bacterium]